MDKKPLKKFAVETWYEQTVHFKIEATSERGARQKLQNALKKYGDIDSVADETDWQRGALRNIEKVEEIKEVA